MGRYDLTPEFIRRVVDDLNSADDKAFRIGFSVEESTIACTATCESGARYRYWYITNDKGEILGKSGGLVKERVIDAEDYCYLESRISELETSMQDIIKSINKEKS